MAPIVLLLVLGAGLYAIGRHATAPSKPPVKPPKETPGKAPPKGEPPQESPPKADPPKVEPTDVEPPDTDGGNDTTARLTPGDMGTFRISQADALILWCEVDVEHIRSVDSSNSSIVESVTTVSGPSVMSIEPEATGMTSITVSWDGPNGKATSALALEVTE